MLGELFNDPQTIFENSFRKVSCLINRPILSKNKMFSPRVRALQPILQSRVPEILLSMESLATVSLAKLSRTWSRVR